MLDRSRSRRSLVSCFYSWLACWVCAPSEACGNTDKATSIERRAHDSIKNNCCTKHITLLNTVLNSWRKFCHQGRHIADGTKEELWYLHLTTSTELHCSYRHRLASVSESGFESDLLEQKMLLRAHARIFKDVVVWTQSLSMVRIRKLYASKRFSAIGLNMRLLEILEELTAHLLLFASVKLTGRIWYIVVNWSRYGYKLCRPCHQQAAERQKFTIQTWSSTTLNHPTSQPCSNSPIQVTI